VTELSFSDTPTLQEEQYEIKFCEQETRIQEVSFCVVTPCSLVGNFRWSEEPIVSIFYPEVGGERFLPETTHKITWHHNPENDITDFLRRGNLASHIS
jgi:hypothetical protein